MTIVNHRDAHFPGSVGIQAVKHFNAELSCWIEMVALGWVIDVVIAWTTIETESVSVCCICILDIVNNFYFALGSPYSLTVTQKVCGIDFLSDNRQKIQEVFRGDSAT
jgi:hypothetical protein